MRDFDQFELPISNLKPGINAFKFEINDSFFSEFPESPLSVGAGKCDVQIDQKVNLLTIDFKIDVDIELICDRSLEKFVFPIKVAKTLIVKFGDHSEEIDENMVVVSWDERLINLAQYIYEFIVVAVPMKRIHPKYATDDESDFDEIIYSSKSEDKNQSVDPRWAALKKLK